MEEKLSCVLVQNNGFQNLYVKVAKWGWNSKHIVIDRSCVKGFDINDCGVNFSKYAPVVVYGSTDFVEAASKSEHLAKYIFNDREQFSMSNLCSKMHLDMFNCHGVNIPVSSKLWGDGIWMKGAASRKVFIRPDTAHKPFNGGLYTQEEWMKLVAEKQLSDDLMCWAAIAKMPPMREWRCWIIDGRIITYSQYFAHGKPVEQRETMTDVQWLQTNALSLKLQTELKDKLPACFTMDVCQPLGINSSMSIMELNCINTSGFYDFEKVPFILEAWMDYLTKKE